MQHLSREELLGLLRKARDNSERDWLMILVGFWHGLRVSEIISLTPEHLNDGYLTIQRLKGSLKTTQPLIEDDEPLLNEKRPLQSYAARRLRSARLFDITRIHLWRIFRRHCESAGIAKHKAHPHILKHSIAMQTIELAGIENVRGYLGHKSISSTGAYLRVDDDVASKAISGAMAKKNRK